MLLPALFVLSLVLIIDVQSYTKAFDVVVILYTIGAIAAIVAFWRLKKNEENTNEERKYVFKKKVLTWKRRLLGKWEKIERKGLADFMVFHGAPAFVANMNKDANFTTTIVGKNDDENILSISVAGFPVVEGVFGKIGTNENDAEEVETKDPSKRKVLFKSWWDEENKQLLSKATNTVTGIVLDQIRRVSEDDILFVKVTATKPDGATVFWEATLRRTK